MAVTINLESITRKISIAPKVKAVVLASVKKNVETAKEKMLQSFDNHKVTKEIEDGESTNNSSRLLYGYGNLFSFIGFNQGDEPIELVRNILKQHTKLRYETARYSKFIGKGIIQFGFLVETPNLDELYSKTEYPDPKTRSGSWLEGLESGLYGLQSYLYNDDGSFEEYNSRSTTGLQAKNGQKIIIVRKGDARSIKYMSLILKELQANLVKK